MTRRDRTPIGAPCRVELSTPDVDAGRRSHGAPFGREVGEPVAGGMGA